jgi:hypothetical protein
MWEKGVEMVLKRDSRPFEESTEVWRGKSIRETLTMKHQSGYLSEDTDEKPRQ